jgi:prepilin-type N-terminal cleavage/methylation domain-containing protein
MSWTQKQMLRHSNLSGLRRQGQSGFSAAELLVVVAIIGLVVAVAIPLIAENVRQAKIRAAGDQFAISLKAARMIAVSTHSDVAVTVNTDPTNTYSYTDNKGKLREFAMPDGVIIASSDDPITFSLNGSLTGGAAMSTVLETDMTSGVIERWTITTSLMGVSSIDHVKVTP